MQMRSRQEIVAEERNCEDLIGSRSSILRLRVRPRHCQNVHVPRGAAAGTISKILESFLIQEDCQKIPPTD